MSAWRNCLPAIKAMIESSSEFRRDPWTVCILKANPHKLFSDPRNSGILNFHPPTPDSVVVIMGVGVAKRNRYAKTADMVNPERGIRIALDRAYRDIYDQSINLYGSYMLVYSASVDPTIKPKEFAFTLTVDTNHTQLPPFEEVDSSILESLNVSPKQEQLNRTRLNRYLKGNNDAINL